MIVSKWKYTDAARKRLRSVLDCWR